MLPIFDGVRDVTLASVCLRMVLSVLCGGAIGVEREFKRRPAGFRTHMLVCMGAAMTMLLGQYEYTLFHTIWSDHAAAGRGRHAGHRHCIRPV